MHVWRHAQVLIAGALLAVEQRTVSAVLPVMGLGQLLTVEPSVYGSTSGLAPTSLKSLAASSIA